jgi:hypothetical protein
MGETLGKRPPDPTGGTGDDDVPAGYSHSNILAYIGDLSI